MDKKISIIIATYNRPDFLYEAVESAKRQTVPCEIIVIDDGSYPRYNKPDGVKFIRRKHNGAVQAWRFAYYKASGDYIFNLDDDDILADNAIERLLDTIKGHDVAFCDLMLYPDMVPFPQKFEGYDALKLNNTMPDPKLITKEVALEVPVPDMEVGWDYERNLRICEKGFKIAHCKEYLYFYRQHSGQIQKTRAREQTENNILSKKLRNNS